MLRDRPIRNRLITGINTTVFSIAMSAVVFVMLLIYLAYAPPPHSHFNNPEFPKVGHSVALRRALREDAITIKVTRDSKVFYSNYLMRAEDLPPKISQDLQRGSEPRVYLKVDARAPYRTVKQVLASVQSAGIENIAFFTDQQK